MVLGVVSVVVLGCFQCVYWCWGGGSGGLSGGVKVLVVMPLVAGLNE